MLQALSPSVSIPTINTLNSRLWSKFYGTISRIRELAINAEFTTLTFDGWSTHPNESIIGFMISTLNDKLATNTINYCIDNVSEVFGTDWDREDEMSAIERAQNSGHDGTYEKITTVWRAIRTAIKRSHAFASLFEECQSAKSV